MTKTNNSSWQQLYRSLLRSSSASVRFSRPAARNTRRYVRDEFASAILATQPAHGQPRGNRSHEVASDVTGGDSSIDSVRGDKSPGTVASNELKQQHQDPSWQHLLGEQTRNTLAFHLSSSLLQNSTATRSGSAIQIPMSSAVLARSSIAGQHIDDPPSPVRERLGNNAWQRLGGAEPQVRAIEVGSHCNESVGCSLTPTKTSRLAHRVISNLASLTYHHLSPHTQMQSRAHLKDNRVLRKPKRLSSLARVLGKLDGGMASDSSHASSNSGSGIEDALGDRDGETIVNEAHMRLSFLMPTVKPKRGPLSAKLKEWDGQDAEKIGSEGNLKQMETDLATIERLLEEYGVEASRERFKQQSKIGNHVEQLKVDAGLLRKKIKSATKALAQAESQRQLENVPIEHLSNIVAAAQDAEGILLGKNRWTRRKNEAFLPP